MRQSLPTSIFIGPPAMYYVIIPPRSVFIFIYKPYIYSGNNIIYISHCGFEGFFGQQMSISSEFRG